MLIEIAGIPIEVTKKRIKNMHLRIYPPDGLVKVSAPLHYKESVIKAFLVEKSAWIDAQRKRIREHAPATTLLETGSVVLFKGQSYILIMQEHHGPTHIKCNEGFIYCSIQPNPTQAQITNALERWYQSEMSALLPGLIKHWESIIGVRVYQWGIKK